MFGFDKKTSNEKTSTPGTRAKASDTERAKKLSSIAGAAVAIALFGCGYGIWATVQANSAIDASLSGTTPTLSAKGAISAGTPLDASLFEVKNVPQAFRAQGALGSDAFSGDSSIEGKLALSDIAAGAQITDASVAGGKGTSSLAASIETGMEAVTIATDVENGLGGALRQNDRVRVIGIESAASGETVVTTLCVDARVAALDASLGTTDGTYTSVTLSVKPEQADAIRAAQSTGSVSLALNPTVG